MTARLAIQRPLLYNVLWNIVMEADNMQFNIRLSMLIKGSFYAFYDNYHKYDNAALIDEICEFLGQCTR